MIAESWGYPTPVIKRVVQTLPGPIPIFTMSAAPEIKSSCTISGVATFPAMMVSCGNVSLIRLTRSTKYLVYPLAASTHTRRRSTFVLTVLSFSNSSSLIPRVKNVLARCTVFLKKSTSRPSG